VGIFNWIWKSAVALSSLIWLAKIVAENVANKRLEKFKSELRLDEFRTTSLHEKRAGVIADIYGKLFATKTACDLYLASSSGSIESRNERAAAVWKEMRELSDYIECNSIYLEQDICDRVQSFLNKAFDQTVDFEMFTSAGPLPDKPGTDAEYAVLEAFHKNVRPILEDLKTEFRRILGVQDGGK